jgi:hypothetical protein
VERERLSALAQGERAGIETHLDIDISRRAILQDGEREGHRVSTRTARWTNATRLDACTSKEAGREVEELAPERERDGELDDLLSPLPLATHPSSLGPQSSL